MTFIGQRYPDSCQASSHLALLQLSVSRSFRLSSLGSRQMEALEEV